MNINKLRKDQKNLIIEGIDSFTTGFLVYKNDDTQRILYSNKAAWEIFECENEFEFVAHVGGTLKGIILSIEADAVQASMNSQLTKGSQCYYVKYRIRTQNGNIKYVECYGHIYENSEYGSLIAMQIIAKVKEYDPLTSLPEKKYFLDKINSGNNKTYNSCKKPAFLSFNLNGFKMFNTRYSLKIGDELLIQFADILMQQFERDNCSRFGDDHFFAICEADKAAEKSNNLFESIKKIENGISCRAGVFIQDLEKPVYSGIACEYAKTAADHITQTLTSQLTFFDENMKKKLSIKNYILSTLDDALKNGYIKPYYQAQMYTADESLHGFEALARWQDPDKGLILPGDFIPVLEEYGLISKVDIYIIEQAAMDITCLIEKGIKVLPVSFNLSFADFAEEGLYDKVVNIINKYELSRSLFRFELTESTLILAYDKMMEEMQRFRDGGFEIMIDHFGGKNSTLTTLLDFEFDEIKIDMSFMRKFNEKTKTIIRPIIILAKSLGIHTLAEGVETQDQIDFLKSTGCEIIQGYYYSAPEPFDEAVKVLTNSTEASSLIIGEEPVILPEENAYEITQDATELKRITSGLGSAFSSAHIVEVQTGSYREVFANYLLHSFIGGSKSLDSKQFADAICALCSTEYVNEILKFTELKTLSDRLKNKSIITCDFIESINHTLMRCSYVVINRIEDGSPSRLIFFTRVLSDTERSEGEFKKIISSYANVCFLMIQVELIEFNYRVAFIHEELKNLLTSSAQLDNFSKNTFIESFVSEAFKEKLFLFLDAQSFAERLWNKDYICMNYLNNDERERRVVIAPLQTDAHGNVLKVVIVFEKIDNSHNLEAEKNYNSEHDELTGLLNRNAYKKYTEELKLSVSPISYVLMDINNFAKINSKHGQKMGDHVLRRLASLLREEFMFSDYIFRLGGDEFGIIITEFNISELEKLTQRIERINKALMEPEFDFPSVSISAGIAISMNGFKNELFRKADVALYQAKNSYSEKCYNIFESSFTKDD